jgi:ATP-dependent DNA helicase DinG
MSITLDILKDETLIFLDLETTGLNVPSDKIIEIGALKVRNGKIIEKFHELINPQVPLMPFIIHLTKIKNEDLIFKPTIEQKAPELFSFLNKHLIICHNASFEKEFLEAVKKGGLENSFLDTCELSVLLYPTLENYRLDNLLKIFKIRDYEVHRALIDAEDTYRLWCSLFTNLSNNDLRRIQMINHILSQTSLPIKKIFFDLSKSLKKHLRQETKEKKFFSSSLQAKVKDKNYIHPQPKKQQIDKSIVKEIFKTNGLLSQTLENYEVRKEQMLMSEWVTEAFNRDKFLVIEAGTGVGKSLGYLIPCVIFSHQNKERVIISTNTKNLQDQLTQKDIPLIRRILKINFETAVVKGRDNYLCLRKLKELLRDLQDFDNEGKFALAYLVSFKSRSREGLLSEISPYLLKKNKYLEDFKNFLSSESPFCLKDECPHFRDECFYRRMIKRAQQANIIIANHSLIFSQPHWMPDYTYLVLDEAHNIEDAATRAFTEEIALKELRMLINSLMQEKTKKGLYFTLKKKRYSPKEKLEILKNQVLQSKVSLENLSNKLFTFFILGQKSLEARIITRNITDFKKEPEFNTIEETCLKLVDSLEGIVKSLFLLSHLSMFNFTDRLKISGFAEKIELKVRLLKELSSSNNQERIRWIEFCETTKGDKEDKAISFSWKFFSSPLNVANALAESIFAHLKAAILTGATLTVGGNFSFLSERIGLNLLEKKRIIYKSIGSPFDFQKHVILGVPKGFPLYNHGNSQEFIEALVDGIKKIVLAIRGKNLILFSSRKRMKEVYMKIKKPLERKGVLTLCQDLDGSRFFIIKQLREARQDILALGSKSFQEGIDVSGLSAVVIDKLPFPHRQDPIISARREYLIKKGRNPFKEYELPLAAIALKQSFGRLIRKKSDFGLVIIFDSRLINKDYKEYIMKSLPQSQLIYLSEKEFYLSLKEKFSSLKKRNG